MVRLFLAIGFYLVFSFSNQLFAQKIIKTDSLTYIKVGTLMLDFEILDSIYKCNDLIAPKYPLGEKHLDRLLHSVSYPPYEDSTAMVEGVVIVKFTIDTDGYAKDILIKNNLNNYITNDITTIINKLQKFEPAKCNGRPVTIRVKYKINYKYK